MCSYELHPWIRNYVTVSQQHSKRGARSVVDNSVLRDACILQILALIFTYLISPPVCVDCVRPMDLEFCNFFFTYCD